MKRLIYVYTILFALLGSCKDILDENPKTILSPDEFFTNGESYESFVKGIYSGLPLYVTATHELLIDIYRAPDASVEQALPIYNNTPTPSYYNARDAWNGPYSMIKNANFLLENVDAAPLDQSAINALKGEARFLRAMAFFDLVQLFGDVPLPRKSPKNYDELKLTRSPQDSVYDLISEDLAYAETNLPDVAAQRGRAYKKAATALLARVYLTRAGNPLNETQYYAMAKQKADEVIQDGRFKLMENYADVFHHIDYTTESIFEKLYVPGRNGSGLHNVMATATTYKPSLMPSSAFIASFPKGDRRKEWGIREKYAAPEGTLALPFFHKFVDTTLIDNGTGPSQAIVSYTLPILRLAEMYLIAATAENEMNGPANAYAYINVLRKRARIDKDDPTEVPDLAGLTQAQLREALVNEYNWEFYAEGHGWQNMKRTNTFQRIQQTRGSSLRVPIGPYNQTWLIPTEEITSNNIPQNPLYQ